MNIEPLLSAPLAVQLHVATVVPAGVIGAVQLASPKGTIAHKTLGYLFIALMLAAAVASFFIRTRSGGFTWIHLFIPMTFFSLVLAYWGVKSGNIRRHQNAMTGLYIGAIGIAGLLTFLPGRIMHQMFLGS